MQSSSLCYSKASEHPPIARPKLPTVVTPSIVLTQDLGASREGSMQHSLRLLPQTGKLPGPPAPACPPARRPLLQDTHPCSHRSRPRGVRSERALSRAPSPRLPLRPGPSLAPGIVFPSRHGWECLPPGSRGLAHASSSHGFGKNPECWCVFGCVAATVCVRRACHCM